VAQTEDGARTIFDDGSTIDSDVVVGADGIH
jgi:2-polyprenyl-6-methoxyphenol hydroxylase-like FAD-dependent oxidoreductase